MTVLTVRKEGSDVHPAILHMRRRRRASPQMICTGQKEQAGVLSRTFKNRESMHRLQGYVYLNHRKRFKVVCKQPLCGSVRSFRFQIAEHSPTTRPSRRKYCRESSYAFGSVMLRHSRCGGADMLAVLVEFKVYTGVIRNY